MPDRKFSPQVSQAFRDYGAPATVVLFFVYEVMWPHINSEQARLDQAIRDLTLITERQARIQEDLSDLTSQLSGDVVVQIQDLDRRVIKLEMKQDR